MKKCQTIIVVCTVMVCFSILWQVPSCLGEEWQVVVGGEEKEQFSLPSTELQTLATQEVSNPLQQVSRQTFVPQPLSVSECIDPIYVTKTLSFDERCDWFKSKIGLFMKDLNSIAESEGLPPKLLAAVVLNELADVGMEDVVQDQQLSSTEGKYSEYEQAILKASLWWKSIATQSYGIAQISPKTAMKYDAVPIPPSMKNRMKRQNEQELYIAYRLLDRRTSIHAAARIIKGVMQEIEMLQGQSPWVKQFLVEGKRFKKSDPYAALTLDPRLQKRQAEMKLAQMVIGIYNSAGILNAAANKVPKPADNDATYFPNALKHSQNGSYIMQDFSGQKNPKPGYGACDLGFKPFSPATGDDLTNDGVIAWVNLFGKNDKSGRIHVGSLQQFETPKRYIDERFGGKRITHLNKKKLFGGKTFESIGKAKSTLCTQITNKRIQRISGWGPYPKGDFGGKSYYIDGLGCEIPGN